MKHHYFVVLHPEKTDVSRYYIDYNQTNRKYNRLLR